MSMEANAFGGSLGRLVIGGLTVAAIPGCSGVDRGGTSPDASTSVVSASPSDFGSVASASGQARLDDVRARFVVTTAVARTPAAKSAAATSTRPVLGEGVVDRFELAGERVRPVLPAIARRSVLRTATVELPLHANGEVALEDDTTRVAVRFALLGARDAPIETAHGIAVYRGALEGADDLHRVHAEGSEDFLVFDAKPEREEIAYRVDVSRVAGLRLVSNLVEFLDEGGTPRLRIATPYVVGANGNRREARLSISGCAYDANPAAPWGRAVAPPGATSCEVRVAWSGVAYPAIVDPNWSSTGSMTAYGGRLNHTATPLSSGTVLVTGGQYGSSFLSTAELFDGTSSFAATGYLKTGRAFHTATLLASGRVLVAAGVGSAGDLSSAELFDATGVFTATGPMTAARMKHSATLLGSGNVLLAGGYDGMLAVSSAELFDGWNTFTATGAMKVARYSHTATLLPSGKVLVAGGYQSELVGSIGTGELFDETNGFKVTGSMTTPRYGHSATLLASGKVLFAGGWHDSFLSTETLSTAELFDGTSYFSATGSMSQARGGHSGTLLGSGRVLIAGGDFESALSSSEVFDGTSSFAPTGAMTSPRWNHTATLLKSGKVLAAGGQSDGFTVLSTAELYTLLAAGAPCSVAGECASGICDEKCCSAACNGSCQTCDSTGACVAVKGADDPDTCTTTKTCSASGACLFKAGSLTPNAAMCASGIAVDSVCCAGPCPDPTMTCAAGSGACLLKNGQASSGAASCASGFVADGVCCNTACKDICARCDSTPGICSNTIGPPVNGRGPCAGPSVGACGYQCDGRYTTQCSAPPASTPCSASACVGATETHASLCDGAGRCKDVPRTCAPYGCDAAACKTTCTAPSDCAAGFTCVSGACVPVPKLGDPCTDASRCPAGAFCTDGVCCAQASCGSGAACNTPTKAGSCAKTTGTKCGSASECGTGFCTDGVCCTDASCGSGAACDTPTKAGSCAKTTGSSCGSASECGTGFCVDGVCCDTACTGQCAACDRVGAIGTCTPVVGQPHGARPACASGGGKVCAARTCDGINPSSCGGLPSATTVCSKASCANGTLSQASSCDGKGACGAPTTRTCAPYACADATKCGTSCATNADCVSGYSCANGTCSAITATCSADGTQAVATDGSGATACAPYRCDPSSGNCYATCAAGDECASGATCDNGVCQPGANTTSSGGCSTSPVEGSVAIPAIGLLAALMLRTRRRRRR